PIKKLKDNTFSIVDQYGKLLFATPNLQVKNIFKFSEIKDEPTTPVISYRDRIRYVLLEGVDVTWDKKLEQGVWALFEDATKELGEILVGFTADIAPTKKQIDRLFSISRGSLCKILLGTKWNVIMYQRRYLPIQSKQICQIRIMTTHYRFTLTNSYNSLPEDENNRIVDDVSLIHLKNTLN
ncbi:3227_t:CDS:2, partial [Gigaspora rosea]